MRYVVAFAVFFAMNASAFHFEARLPWTEVAHASETSNEESSARYLTKDSLQRRIEQKRTRCNFDGGRFTYHGGNMSCRRDRGSYTCEASATCYCNGRSFLSLP